MDSAATGGGHFDLLESALTSCGLDDLMQHGDSEQPQEQQPSEVDTEAVVPQPTPVIPRPSVQTQPLAQRTTVQPGPSQFFRVETAGSGDGPTRVISALSKPTNTPVKVIPSSHTPAKIIRLTSGNVPTSGQLTNGEQRILQQLVPGLPGNSRVIITGVRSGSNTPGTQGILVNTPSRTGTPQSSQGIIVTPQGPKTGASRRILMAQNGQPTTSAITTVGGQVVLANIQSPQQVRASSPQILQATGVETKTVITRGNGRVVHVRSQTPLSTGTLSQTSRTIRVASPTVQPQAIRSVPNGQSHTVVQAAGASSSLPESCIIQPSPGQFRTIGQSKTGSQVIISQSGLAGAKVISASPAPSPGPSLGTLHHSFSRPALSKEGSRSRSNSPVMNLGNIPNIVTQKVSVKNLAGGSGSSKDIWSKEEMTQRAFFSASMTRRKKVEDVADEAEEESEELGHAETYAEYKPRKVDLGQKHPDQVVESSSLSSVEPPNVCYTLSIPEEVMDQGLLSALQLEAITYACQRHEVILLSGDRAGYLIGDGAGVGKGRTVAGIIYENYLQGRKRALWLSVSNDLKVDAERDLEDIGAKNIKVYALNKFRYAKLSSKENGSVKKGVIFVTYSSLIGESSQSQNKYRTRIKQLIKWCGKDFDGPIIFDECHKAKNLCPTGSSKPTKTGMAVLDLQKYLPMARIVYASATGATEPKNMAYMTRLGLWGKGTTFPEFNDFITSVEKRGVGAMELVAMDMKLRGMYIARQLSFKGVSFHIEEVPLEDSFKRMYNRSVEVWMEARAMFQKAADLIKADHRMRKSMWGQFWSAHQRFFKYLCISAKVPHCVNLAREAFKVGKCVVIGLQSTGEARTQELVEQEGGDLNDFVSTAKGVLQTLVEKHFPAADRNKTLDLLGLGGLFQKSDLGMKRKRDEPSGSGVNKRARMEDSSDDDDDDDSDIDSISSPDFDDSSDDDSDADSDRNPFQNFSDDGDSDPWVKKPKKKTDKGKKKKEEKKKKKKKKKVDSDEEQDMLLDRTMNNIEMMKRSTSLAALRGSSKDDDDPDNQNGMHLALQIKGELMNLVEQLGDSLPPNTLDQLIDELGGPEMVAEMTGRKGRVVQGSDGIQYESRSESDVPLEILNLKEKERFMDGEKDVAIISEAASSGISLQADRRAANQKRRVHITLELPWSADRAIQQFGRTHRSNQVSAPEYIFLISDLAGERRFASTVAKRLESLGALTHGDRRATESRDLSRFNIDNRFGRTALETVMKSVLGLGDAIVDPPASYTKEKFFEEVKKALEGVGLITIDRSNVASLEKEYNNISKFLNRLLGMPTDLQNALFDYFNSSLSAIILEAKRSGRWDMGILDVGSGQEVVQRMETQVFVDTAINNRAKTELSTIQVERGMSWDDAMNIWRRCNTPEEGFYLSTQERNMKRTATLVTLQGRNKKKEKVYNVYRPNTGLQTRAETLEEVKKKYKKVLPDNAEKWWADQYLASAKSCTHAYWNGNCRKVSVGLPCEVGLRTRRYHVLSGSVLSVWSAVEGVMTSMPGGSTSKMQIVRLKTGDGQKIVGSLIPSNFVPPLVNTLKKNTTKYYTESHNQTLSSAISGLQSSAFPSTSSSSSSAGSLYNSAITMGTDSGSSEQAAAASPRPAAELLLSMPLIE
ncbi:protein strawberry notch homolog 1-like isoform X2 [Babylonia areolata]|uniref:protein strawberry notch homolog 1-like isoform X2 n=1 Tax=Babylonia areolata TaxID=304850 RepID=UPI003FD375A2